MAVNNGGLIHDIFRWRNAVRTRQPSTSRYVNEFWSVLLPTWCTLKLRNTT